MDCSIAECSKQAICRGLCPTHYTRFRRHGDPTFTHYLPRGSSSYDLLLKRGVERNGECLLYKGSVSRTSGYGYADSQLAHRVVYEHWNGAIPGGMLIDHTCHNEATLRGECPGGACSHKRCVNPAHLRLATKRTNNVNSVLAGGRTHCKRGHEYTPENTYFQPARQRPGGCGYARVCRTCRKGT